MFVLFGDARRPRERDAEPGSDAELVPAAAVFGGSTRVARRAGALARAACAAAALLSAAVACVVAAGRAPAGRRAAVADVVVAAEVPSTTPWWVGVPVQHLTVTTTYPPNHARTTNRRRPEPDWFDQLGGGTGADLALAPRETMNDGNACGDDEELYHDLCYKRCAALTLNEYPIRTSAWTCCKSRPCTLFNQVHDAGICSGFDVAGDVEGNDACPHRPGACLSNEELFMGMCYKKCRLLIPEYPTRYAASTCCNGTGLSCLTTKGVTLPEFAIGGGGDDDDPSTPAEVHPPLLQLTEKV